jgi:hypothetical protein
VLRETFLCHQGLTPSVVEAPPSISVPRHSRTASDARMSSSPMVQSAHTSAASAPDSLAPSPVIPKFKSVHNSTLDVIRDVDGVPEYDGKSDGKGGGEDTEAEESVEAPLTSRHLFQASIDHDIALLGLNVDGLLGSPKAVTPAGSMHLKSAVAVTTPDGEVGGNTGGGLSDSLKSGGGGLLDMTLSGAGLDRLLAEFQATNLK